MLGSDSGTDPKVKKKLIAVLASLNAQFKDDPSMSFVASLYNSVKPPRPVSRTPAAAAAARASIDRPSLDDDTFQIDAAGLGMGNSYEDRRRREEQERKEEKRRAKEAKEAEKRKKLEEEQKKKAQGKVKRKAFNYEEVCRCSAHVPETFLIILVAIGETPNPNYYRKCLRRRQ